MILFLILMIIIIGILYLIKNSKIDAFKKRKNNLLINETKNILLNNDIKSKLVFVNKDSGIIRIIEFLRVKQAYGEVSVSIMICPKINFFIIKSKFIVNSLKSDPLYDGYIEFTIEGDEALKLEKILDIVKFDKLLA